ncbi:hypothetical protein CHS0354_010421 [Potamilus streckersoni]|uniref:Uncharacterized protein n=1 Tax=Potamilus streckersoni TaxID=2493646 RepID=A0AAE0VIE9_9BIVA|nr:hypothetical protein CHS0354_010421 [Potamilus streckersoni]
MQRESYSRQGDSGKIFNNKIRRSPSPLFSGMNNLSLDTGPRKRASSFKKPKKVNPDEFDEGLRPRTSSMPTRNSFKKPSLYMTRAEPSRYNLHSDTDFYMCRHFETTSKGVIVNRGDSLRSKSTNSMVSSGSEVFPLSQSSPTSSSLSHESLGSVSALDVFTPYKILVTGGLGVGKTGLTQQFMTSEYLGGFDTSQGIRNFETGKLARSLKKVWLFLTSASVSLYRYYHLEILQ